MTTATLKPGDQVEIRLPADSHILTVTWWPKGRTTGTVQKVFKNGKVAVAVHQMKNRSGDGLETTHFPADILHVIAAGCERHAARSRAEV